MPTSSLSLPTAANIYRATLPFGYTSLPSKSRLSMVLFCWVD